MKKRSVASVVLLTIVTLGIYALFWLYYTKKDLMRYGQKIPSMWTLFLPVLLIIQVMLIAAVTGGLREGSDTSFSPGFMVVISLLYVFATFYPLYWMYQYCKAASAATNNYVQLGWSYAVYVVTWVMGITMPIWVGMMQDSFNKATMIPEFAPGSTGKTSANAHGPISKKGWQNPQNSGPVTTGAHKHHHGNS